MRSALSLALAVTASIQQPPASALQSSVRVDVIATDARDRVVDDLQRSDFDLREDSASQTIEALRFVGLRGVGLRSAVPADAPPASVRSEFDEREEAVQDETRLVAIFIDEYHLSPGPGTQRVREALVRFIDRDLGPRDLAVVMRPLDSLLAIRLTRDRDVLQQAIEAFDGRKGDYDPRNAFEENYMGRAPATAERLRTQVTISALNALALHLGQLKEGRKAIIVISEGFAGVARTRGAELLPDVQSLLQAATRYHVSIYPIEPQGLDGTPAPERVAVTAAGGPANQPASAGDADVLRGLAENTAGQTIVSDLDDGLRRIVADSSAYYVITYKPVHPDDGKFHAVEVRVKRPGVRVRARPGYWALSPDEALRSRVAASGAGAPTTPAIDLGPRRISPLIRPWFGVDRGPDGQTRVTFVWEPVARVPGDRDRRADPARVVLKAVGADGTTAFEGRVSPAGAAAGDRLDAASRAVFDVPPGQLRMRMSIEDAGAREVDFDAREIMIRSLGAPIELGTPHILRARNALEFRVLQGDPDAVPVADREFSRTERLIIRVAAYGPPDAVPTVTAKLLNRMGQSMRELPVVPPSGPGRPHQIDLPLVGLPASEYFLEVKASSSAGESIDRIGFRVAG